MSHARSRTAIEGAGNGIRLDIRRRLVEAVAWFTTPLLPDDYLGLVDPLWSSRQMSGRVVDLQPETADAATVVIRPGRGWTGHRAGQYVRVGIDIRRGAPLAQFLIVFPAPATGRVHHDHREGSPGGARFGVSSAAGQPRLDRAAHSGHGRVRLA